MSIGGAKYFVTFIDDSTRWSEVYLLGKKSAVLSAFKLYKSHAERLTGEHKVVEARDVKFVPKEEPKQFHQKVELEVEDTHSNAKSPVTTEFYTYLPATHETLTGA
ncbi:hypothetical protein B5X24_HaOG203085, partial [Helicoverpa armigera]